MPEVQTYRTHAHVRCQCANCGCESLVEAKGTIVSPTHHLLERAPQVCPLCRHASSQHECLGEIPFARPSH